MNHNYDDPIFYVQQATKYALILDDIALKSSKDQDRWLLGHAAQLLRQLGVRIQEYNYGETESSATKQTQF